MQLMINFSPIKVNIFENLMKILEFWIETVFWKLNEQWAKKSDYLFNWEDFTSVNNN